MKAASLLENTAEKRYAGAFARISSYVLDCMILFAGLLVWQAALYIVNPIVSILKSGGQPTGLQLHLWVFVSATIPFLLYFTLMLRSAKQATLGMRLLKIKVNDVEGNRIGFGKALVRSALMLIPFELNHTLMFHLAPRDAPPSGAFWFGYAGVWAVMAIYIALIFLTRRRQSVHDLIAGTIVEKIK